MKKIIYSAFYIVKFLMLEFLNFFLFIKNLIINRFDNFGLINFIISFFQKKNNFKNNDINKFISKNKKLTEQEKIKKGNNEILVELLLSHHSEPMIMNCLIAKDLQRIYKARITALINKEDILTKKIAESFGIKNFIYHKKNNIFQNFIFFLRAMYIYNYRPTNEKFKNIKYKNFEIGKSALENYLRWHNNNLFKKDKFLLIYFLSKSILSIENSLKIFETKFKYFVIGEIQFIPNKLLFHTALKKNVPVYCNFGTSIINFIGRIYKNYKDRNSVQLKLSKKLSDLLVRIFKNKNIFSKLEKLGAINNIGKEIVWSNTIKTQTKIFKSKDQLCKYLKIDKKKKIVLILPHAMADNLFNNEWNLFETAYDWYLATIKKIKNDTSVNWLIKPHPYEYKFPGITAKNIFDNENVKNKNIVFLKEYLHIPKFYKFVDLVITGNGSAGYQYSSLNIPTITTSDTKYSNFNFTLSPKTQNEYFRYLKNVKTIPRLSKDKIKRAQIYWYSNISLLYNSHEFLPKIKQHGLFKKEEFFEKISKKQLTRFKKNSFSDDVYHQINNINRHTINTKFYKKYKNKFSFKLNDI